MIKIKLESYYYPIMILPGIGPIIAFTVLDLSNKKYDFYSRKKVISGFLSGFFSILPFYLLCSYIFVRSENIIAMYVFSIIVTIVLDYWFLRTYKVIRYGNQEKSTEKIAEEKVMGKKLNLIYYLLLMIPLFGSFMCFTLVYLRRSRMSDFSFGKYIMYVLLMTIILIVSFLFVQRILPIFIEINIVVSMVLWIIIQWPLSDYLFIKYFKTI